MSFPFTDVVEVPEEVGYSAWDKVLLSLWQINF